MPQIRLITTLLDSALDLFNSLMPSKEHLNNYMISMSDLFRANEAGSEKPLSFEQRVADFLQASVFICEFPITIGKL